MGGDKATASRHLESYKSNCSIIKNPSTQEELQGISHLVYNVSRFSTCIGALDCTHVKIISPDRNNAEIVRNPKGFFSYNVLAVCDASVGFEDVVCRWPGSTCLT